MQNDIALLSSLINIDYGDTSKLEKLQTSIKSVKGGVKKTSVMLREETGFSLVNWLALFLSIILGIILYFRPELKVARDWISENHQLFGFIVLLITFFAALYFIFRRRK